MLASPHSVLRFHAFTLDPVRCVLIRGGSELRLRQQSFEVLRFLAEHAGKVVSSDELIRAVWASEPADHNSSVGQCIKEIRRALGDDARWIIKTVSGLGYEFKAEVVPLHLSPQEIAASAPEISSVGPCPEVEAPSEAQSLSSAHPTTIRETDHPCSSAGSDSFTWRQRMFAIVVLVLALGAAAWLLQPRAPVHARGKLTMMAAPTIAVLPFTVLDPPNSEKGTAGGLADELRSALARAPRGFGLIIKSAADFQDRAFVLKEDGPRLGVRYVVLGSTWLDRDVRHANIQLLELETDTLVWSESFETRLG